MAKEEFINGLTYWLERMESRISALELQMQKVSDRAEPSLAEQHRW